MNRSDTTLSNHETMAAEVVHHRKIIYKPMPFVICEDFEYEWTEFCTLCGSDTASDCAWKLFEKVIMKATYESEDEFDEALFDALAKALGGKCCHINSRKKMIIIEKQTSWGFARQAHHNENVDSGSSANFAHDDHECWHDHACILFKDST